MIATLIASFWPYILAGGGVVVALVAAWGTKKTTQTAKAQVSAAQSDAKAQVSTEQVAEAQANTTAAQAGAAANQTATAVQNDVAAQSPVEVKNELDAWTK